MVHQVAWEAAVRSYQSQGYDLEHAKQWASYYLQSQHASPYMTCFYGASSPAPAPYFAMPSFMGQEAVSYGHHSASRAAVTVAESQQEGGGQGTAAPQQAPDALPPAPAPALAPAPAAIKQEEGSSQPSGGQDEPQPSAASPATRSLGTSQAQQAQLPGCQQCEKVCKQVELWQSSLQHLLQDSRAKVEAKQREADALRAKLQRLQAEHAQLHGQGASPAAQPAAAAALALASVPSEAGAASAAQGQEVQREQQGAAGEGSSGAPAQGSYDGEVGQGSQDSQNAAPGAEGGLGLELEPEQQQDQQRQQLEQQLAAQRQVNSALLERCRELEGAAQRAAAGAAQWEAAAREARGEAAAAEARCAEAEGAAAAASSKAEEAQRSADYLAEKATQLAEELDEKERLWQEAQGRLAQAEVQCKEAGLDVDKAKYEMEVARNQAAYLRKQAEKKDEQIRDLEAREKALKADQGSLPQDMELLWEEVAAERDRTQQAQQEAQKLREELARAKQESEAGQSKLKVVDGVLLEAAARIKLLHEERTGLEAQRAAAVEQWQQDMQRLQAVLESERREGSATKRGLEQRLAEAQAALTAQETEMQQLRQAAAAAAQEAAHKAELLEGVSRELPRIRQQMAAVLRKGRPPLADAGVQTEVPEMELGGAAGGGGEVPNLPTPQQQEAQQQQQLPGQGAAAAMPAAAAVAALEAANREVLRLREQREELVSVVEQLQGQLAEREAVVAADEFLQSMQPLPPQPPPALPPRFAPGSQPSAAFEPAGLQPPQQGPMLGSSWGTANDGGYAAAVPLQQELLQPLPPWQGREGLGGAAWVSGPPLPPGCAHTGQPELAAQPEGQEAQPPPLPPPLPPLPADATAAGAAEAAETRAAGSGPASSHGGRGPKHKLGEGGEGARPRSRAASPAGSREQRGRRAGSNRSRSRSRQRRRSHSKDSQGGAKEPPKRSHSSEQQGQGARERARSRTRSRSRSRHQGRGHKQRSPRRRSKSRSAPSLPRCTKDLPKSVREAMCRVLVRRELPADSFGERVVEELKAFGSERDMLGALKAIEDKIRPGGIRNPGAWLATEVKTWGRVVLKLRS